MTDYLILKARNELTGAERERIICAFSAIKSLIVNKAFKINNGDIILLGGAILNGDKAGIAFFKPVDLLIYFFLIDLYLGAFGLKAGIAFYLNFRFGRDNYFKFNALFAY